MAIVQTPPDFFNHETGILEGIASGADQFRDAVRFQVKYGADVIKIEEPGSGDRRSRDGYCNEERLRPGHRQEGDGQADQVTGKDSNLYFRLRQDTVPACGLLHL